MDRTIVKAGGIEVRLDGGGEGFRGSLVHDQAAFSGMDRCS
jgi:hypothetical protein